MQLYEVQAIRKIKFVKGELRFNVKWKGWQDKFNTWEPFENIKNCVWAIQQYNERKRKKARTDTRAWQELRKILQGQQDQTEKRIKIKKIRKIKHKLEINLQKQVTLICQNPFQEQITEKVSQLHSGSFITKDVPLKILDVLKDPNNHQEYIYEVSWAKRKNNEQPLNSWVQARDIKERCPDILYNYLESYIQI